MNLLKSVCVKAGRGARKPLLMCVLAVIAESAGAAGLQDEAAVRGAVDAAMHTIGAGDVRGGLQSLMPYVVVARSAAAQRGFERVALEREAFPREWGKPIGIDFIEQRSRGKSLMRVVYLEKLEEAAVQWSFVFYKPRNEWLFAHIKFDADFKDLF